MSDDLNEATIVLTRIASDEEYDHVHARLHRLIDLGFDNLTADQEALLDHLANLIEAYDQEHESH